VRRKKPAPALVPQPVFERAVEKGEHLNHERPTISAQHRRVLVLRAQRGDTEALNVLLESCRTRLYFLALRILRRPQDAEDAVQEAMLAAFTHLQRFQGRADFLTWASQILINAALQHIRKSRNRPTVALDQIHGEFDAASYSEYLRDPQPSPEEQLQRREHWQIFEKALYKLPLESRRLVELCKFSDYSMKEVSTSLGLPVSTPKVRLHRGKRALIVRIKRETKVPPKAGVRKGSLQRGLPKESLYAA